MSLENENKELRARLAYRKGKEAKLRKAVRVISDGMAYWKERAEVAEEIAKRRFPPGTE